MTLRGFDPTFSAALRDELEHRAEVPERTAGRTGRTVAIATRPRRQAFIAVAVAVVLAVLTVGVLQAARPVHPAPAGYATAPTATGEPTTAAPRTAPAGVVDPLATISDPDGGEFVSPGSYRTVLHRSGTGPSSSHVTIPAGTTSVRAYLACRSGTYRLTIGKDLWAACASPFAAYADLPVTSTTREVTIEVGASTAWAVLVITEPTAAPTTAPTPAVRTTDDPSTDPSGAPDPTAAAPQPSVAPTSSSAPTGLITPTGWHVITRAQLHAYVVASSFSAVWEEQAWLDMQCMAKQGFVYDPTARGGEPGASSGLTAAQQDAYEVAMYGPRTDQPYDWRTAGCHGASVHETGMDDAN